eukprot:scaffold182414_cov30-Attheya_sp.AAC.1
MELPMGVRDQNRNSYQWLNGCNGTSFGCVGLSGKRFQVMFLLSVNPPDEEEEEAGLFPMDADDMMFVGGG